MENDVLKCDIEFTCPNTQVLDAIRLITTAIHYMLNHADEEKRGALAFEAVQ